MQEVGLAVHRKGHHLEGGGPSKSRCIAPETLVPIAVEGVLTLEEVGQLGVPDWSSRGEAGVAFALKQPLSVASAPSPEIDSQITHLSRSGPVPTFLLSTEQGHELRGSFDHRVLCLGPKGHARWTCLRDIRPQEVLLSLHGAGAFGPATTRHWPREALDFLNGGLVARHVEALLGMLGAAEWRQDAPTLPTSMGVQRKAMRIHARQLGLGEPFEASPKWAAFTGLARLTPRLAQLAKLAVSPSWLHAMRRGSEAGQVTWAAALLYTKAQWTLEDFEVEVADLEVARVLQAVLENLGVRVSRFQTLNTFGDPRTKVAMRSGEDYRRLRELAAKVQGENPTLSPTLDGPRHWGRLAVAEEESLHSYGKATVELARVAFERAGRGVDFPEGDFTRESLGRAALELRGFARTKGDFRTVETLALLSDPRCSWDRATGCSQAGVLDCLDATVPIGAHYVTGSLVSHGASPVSLSEAKTGTGRVRGRR